MTNNPRKVAALEELGIAVANAYPAAVRQQSAQREVPASTKGAKLGHMFDCRGGLTLRYRA
jgi:GTP cyclohydrolase II